MAAGVFKGLTIKFDGNTSALESALKGLQAEARKTQKELKQIQNAMKYNPGSSVLMGRSIELMQKRLTNAQKQLDELYKKASKGPESMDTEAWSKLQADIEIAKNKVENFSKALAQAYIKMDASNSTLGKVGQALQDFGERNEKMAQRLQSAGSIMTRGITMPLVAAGAASVAAAIKIDDSLTGVRKTVDGTAEQYAQLKQAAIDFSKTNAVSASQILDIQALGGQLGFTIDELQEFSEVVSGLGVSTDLSFEQAATEMAQFANITKMSHADVSRYGSAIVDLGNHFATTESKISAMAMRIAAAGTQVGMSQADILGLATALSSMGIEAEAGGTAISTIMAQIDKDVSTGSASMETWASTAKMSASEFAAAWQTNPVEALTAVLSGMEEATNAGGNMSLMLDELGISSLRQTDVMKRLAGNSELVGSAVSTANQAWAENTALQTEVDNRNQSLASQFEMLKNRIIAIADSFGGPLASALLDILDAAEPLFQAIADGAKSFSEMDKGQQQAVLSAVALLAALGPLTSGLGKLIGSTKTIGQTLSSAAQLFARLGGAGKQAGQGVEAAAQAVGSMNKASGLSYTALGALRAGLIGISSAAVIAGIAATANEINKMVEYSSNMTTISNGMTDAFAALNGEVVETQTTIQGYGSIVGAAREEVYKAASSQVEFYQSLKDTFGEVGASNALMQSYYDVINELYGRTDLTAQQQAQLAAALKAVGDATGTTYTLTQDQAGAYVAESDGAIQAKDAILELIEAKKLEAQYNAIASKMEEAYKNQATAADAATEAHKAYDDAVAKSNDYYQKFIEGNSAVTAEQNAEYERLLNDAQSAYGVWQSATQGLNEADQAVQQLSDHQALLAMAQQQGASSMAALVASNSQLVSGLMAADQSTLSFATQLQNAGVSVDEFKQLGTDAVWQLSQAYDGSFASIAGVLQQNGVHLSEAAQQSVMTFQQMSADADLASETVQTAITNAGSTVPQFVQAMVDAGVSVQDFAALTPEQLASVASAYSTNTQDWQSLLQGYIDQQNANGQQIGTNLQSGIDTSLAGTETTLASHLQTMDANAAAAAGMPNTVQVFNETTGQFETVASDMVYKTNTQFARLGPEVSTTISTGGGQINAAAQSVAQNVPMSFDSVIPQVAARGAQVGPTYGNAVASGAGAVAGSGQVLVNAASTSLNSGIPLFQQAGQQSGQGYGTSLQSTQGDSTAKAQAIMTAVVQMLQKGIPQAKDAGGKSGSSYAGAIGGMTGAARSAGANLGGAAVSAMYSYVGQAAAAGSAVGSAFARAVSAASSAAHISAPSMPSVATVAAPRSTTPIMPVPIATLAANTPMPMSADTIRSSIESTVARVYEQAERAAINQTRHRGGQQRTEQVGLTESDVTKIIDAMADKFNFTAKVIVNDRELATTTATANDRAIGALRVRRSR